MYFVRCNKSEVKWMFKFEDQGYIAVVKKEGRTARRRVWEANGVSGAIFARSRGGDNPSDGYDCLRLKIRGAWQWRRERGGWRGGACERPTWYPEQFARGPAVVTIQELPPLPQLTNVSTSEDILRVDPQYNYCPVMNADWCLPWYYQIYGPRRRIQIPRTMNIMLRSC